MTAPARVAVVTNIPSYHQVELFDAIAQHGGLDLHVIYLRPITPGRQWTRLPTPRHSHRILPVWGAKSAWFLNPTALTELRALQTDLLVVTQYAGLTYQLAMYLASWRRQPWVFWSEPLGVRHFEVRQWTPQALRPWVRRAAFAPVKPHARAIWGIGSMAQQQMQELTGRPVQNLPYFSDLERFRRPRALWAPQGKVRFLFAGRYSYRKGFDTLLEAFARLERESPEGWQLTLCGDGELRAMLDREPHAGLVRRGRVRDVGFQELAAMPGVMTDHDVFVIPSRYDGWGMVVPEAMAAGLPTVATEAMGSAVDQGPSWPYLRMVPPGDVGALLAQLRWFLRHPERLGELGPQAAHAASRYDARVGAERFADLVDEALCRPRTPERTAAAPSARSPVERPGQMES